MSSRHLLIVAVVGLFASAVHAITIYVDDDNCPGPGSGTEGDPYCSIQTAIDNAVDGDEIVVGPGIYFETIDILGKAIWLHSSDGPDVTIIDGTGFFHVVQCVTGEGPDTVLDGFTITGGNANGVPPDDSGGGMLNDGSSPTVSNCTFSGNTASLGGGMYNDQSSPTITDCTFTSNDAAGGGMCNRNFSSPTVTDCTFTGNTAVAGGGMVNWASSSPTVANCTFSGNSADGSGGGMYNITSSPTVTGCTFTGNTSGNDGGGMYNESTGSPTVSNCIFEGNASGDEGGAICIPGGTVSVTDCRFTDNEGNLGGAIYNAANPTIANCLFNGNWANLVGGAIYNEVGVNSPFLVDCTLVHNEATIAGGAIFNNDFSLPTVANSILRSNNPDQIWDELSFTTVSYSNVHGGWPGLGNIDADPLFVDPADGDLRLSPGSPCIDAGDNTAVPGGEPISVLDNPFTFDPSDLIIIFEEYVVASSIVITDLTGIITYIEGYDYTQLVLPDRVEIQRILSGAIAPGETVLIDYNIGSEPEERIRWDLDGNPRFVDDPDTVDTGYGDPPVVDMGAYEFQTGCPWDCGMPADSQVNLVDFLALLATWGELGVPCDVNGDGFVGITDFLAMLANWGPCP